MPTPGRRIRSFYLSDVEFMMGCSADDGRGAIKSAMLFKTFETCRMCAAWAESDDLARAGGPWKMLSTPFAEESSSWASRIIGNDASGFACRSF